MFCPLEGYPREHFHIAFSSIRAVKWTPSQILSTNPLPRSATQVTGVAYQHVEQWKATLKCVFWSFKKKFIFETLNYGHHRMRVSEFVIKSKVEYYTKAQNFLAVFIHKDMIFVNQTFGWQLMEMFSSAFVCVLLQSKSGNSHTNIQFFAVNIERYS